MALADVRFDGFELIVQLVVANQAEFGAADEVTKSKLHGKQRKRVLRLLFLVVVIGAHDLRMRFVDDFGSKILGWDHVLIV